jgi:exosome complex component RRP42
MTLKLNEHGIRRAIEDGERIDGRDFDEHRDIEIIPNYIHDTADGSALVKVGDTKIVVGISTDTGDPYPDRPNAGALITNAELAPMAAPRFESGPPGDEAVELARVVDRGIRESGMIDLEDLIIEEGETCWMLFVDMHVIDYDGNLIEAGALGAVTALALAQLPEINDDGTVDRDNYQDDLPTEGLPITVTGSKIADQILFDTTGDEEEVLDGWLAMTFKDDGNVVNMQKGASQSLTHDDISTFLDKGEEKAEMFRSKIRDAIERAE